MSRRLVFSARNNTVIFVDSIVMISPTYNKYTSKTDYTVHMHGGHTTVVTEKEKQEIIQLHTYISS